MFRPFLWIWTNRIEYLRPRPSLEEFIAVWNTESLPTPLILNTTTWNRIPAQEQAKFLIAKKHRWNYNGAIFLQMKLERSYPILSFPSRACCWLLFCLTFTWAWDSRVESNSQTIISWTTSYRGKQNESEKSISLTCSWSWNPTPLVFNTTRFFSSRTNCLCPVPIIGFRDSISHYRIRNHIIQSSASPNCDPGLAP